jgi:hypothetical protein
LNEKGYALVVVFGRFTLKGRPTQRLRCSLFSYAVREVVIPVIAVADNYVGVVEKANGCDAERRIARIDWMTGNELAESIPPAFARYVAEQFVLT